MQSFNTQSAIKVRPMQVTAECILKSFPGKSVLFIMPEAQQKEK